MLAIRLQRTGRSGHAQFRVIVQDSRFSPARSRVVAYVGSYDPHTKTATLDGEKISKYLDNGAQPSERVASLLQKEGIKLPGWVKLKQPKERTTRNPDKRRSTRPAEPEAPVAEAAPTEEAALAEETPPTTDESPAEPETPAEGTEPAAEESTSTEPEAPANEEPAEEAAPKNPESTDTKTDEPAAE